MRISDWSSDVCSSDLVEGGVNSEACFSADDQQIKRIGKPLADCGGPFRHLVVYKKIGRLVAEDQNDRECAEFLETAPVRKKIDAINEQHRTAAQQNGKDQAAKDDGDGPIFRTETRLRQLGRRGLHLTSEDRR